MFFSVSIIWFITNEDFSCSTCTLVFINYSVVYTDNVKYKFYRLHSFRFAILNCLNPPSMH